MVLSKEQQKKDAEMQKMLDEDAVWKRIQQNTFMRWVNQHLSQVDKTIASLETDFADGIRFIALLEVLSGKKCPYRYSKRPTVRGQKMENVYVGLKFLTDDEGLKLVNIDSSDIVDCKLKLILGLIWTLILHYSISLPMWEGDDENLLEGKAKTPKERLLKWIQSKIPDKTVKNFTRDWNDGTTLGALVDALAPGLCPNWQKWDPKDAAKNIKAAMDAAEKWLGVAPLIEPDSMANPKVDELSMMTYLSQFPNAKLKDAAPLKLETNPKKVRCFGPGIEPKGVTCGAPTNFTIETFGAGEGNLEAWVEDDKGNKTKVDIKLEDEGKKRWKATYIPKSQGAHKVFVTFAGQTVPKAPFAVNIEGTPGDPKKCVASGPGIEPKGRPAGKLTYFDVKTTGAGFGQVECVITDPDGKTTGVPMKLSKVADDQYKCEYCPVKPGPHTVQVLFAGKSIPKAPFKVNVGMPCNPRRVKASGRGLQKKGVRVGDIADFKILTTDAGDGNVEVEVVDPDGKQMTVDIKQNKDKPDRYDVKYKPVKEGPHKVVIKYGGDEIPKSPYEVGVGPFKESKIIAYGPGLKGGVVDKPAKFIVDTNGETGSLSFSIEGPSKCSIQCEDLGDGSAGVTYTPSAPGDYVVHILCDGEDIPKSPYVATIEPEMDFDLTKVKAFGPGLSPGVQQDKLTEFTVDCKAATSKPESDPNVTVEIHNEGYDPIPVTVKSNKNGTVTCSYKPKDDGKYTVCVNYNGCAVPDSPFKVNVSASADPLKVRVYGPGIEKGVKSCTPTKFFIDCKNAGSAKPKVKMTNEDDDDVKVKVIDNRDGTYTCEYKTPTPGNHFITVDQGGSPVTGSPFKVPVEPHMSTKDVIITGLQPVVYTNSINEFQVDTSKLPKPDDHKIECTIVKPDGSRQAAKVESIGKGKFKVTHIPKDVGHCEYKVSVDGVPVPDSPYPVMVESGCDPSRVKVYGPGIEFGKLNEENKFTIETKGAGTGALGLSIEGPTEAKMTCVDNRDGTCTATYVPDAEGMYRIGVKYGGQDVPGSVFEVPAAKNLDVSKVKCFGPGLEEGKVRAGVPQTFTVDTKEAAGGGKLPVSATVTSSTDGTACPAEVTDIGDGKFSVDYIPPEDEKATCKIEVRAAGKDVPKSPFNLKLKPRAEPSNLKIVGNPPKEVPCSIPQEFVIDTTDAGSGKLDVEVVNPNGEVRPAKTRQLPDGKTKVLFTCDTPGRNKIVTKYDDKEVRQCCFNVEAKRTGDASKCVVNEDDIPKAVAVGKDYEVKVDTRQAGEGRLTGSMVKTGSKTKNVEESCDMETIINRDGTQSVRFKVKEKGEYNFDLRFGGEKVTKTTKVVTTQEVYEESTTTTTSTTYRKETRTTKKYHALQLTNLPTRHKNSADVDAFVKMPSGAIDRPVIVDNQDGTVSIRYDPRQEGAHELHVKFNGEHIQGSPFKFNVDSVASGYVTAYGPGLVHGVANEPTQFHISTKGAASGGLNVAVEGPSKADINYHDNRDGTVTVTYLPAAPGDYKITVKFADEHIKGSPFTAKVTGEGRKRAQISVGHSSEVSLKVQEKDLKALNAYIVAPNGLEEPCFLKQLPNGQLGISFTPRLTGEHSIHVRRQGQEITGSPFKISVLDCEIGDSTRVKTSGAGLTQGITHKPNEFVINTKDAGYGGLSVSMEGPSKADIKVKDNEDGSVKVVYVPTEPGYYILNIKFADHHVRNSPFTVKVDGEGSNVQRERIKKQREAAPVADVGQECKLIFKLPNASALDMDAKVQGPGGDSNPATIRDSDDGAYEVSFVPKVSGVHNVTVRHKKFHIPGSPFQFTVGPLKDYGAHRVHAGGQGLERGVANEPCEFNIWSREAGAGALAVSVEGPSKATIDFKDRKDGSCYISYKVSEPGEYRVGIKFNDQHIPDSPFKVYVMPPVGDAAMIELANVPENIKVNMPVNLSVRMNGAKGTLDGEVIDPSGKKDDAFMCCLDSEEWALRFVPKENGVHHIHIRCDGVHIPQSPFRVLVGTDDADPAAVNAHGPGLKDAVAGLKTEFIVDTTAAGIGKLKVQVDGPTKVSMDCIEVDEGYKVHYTPLAPGDYFIAVKYNGYHISGSPFKVTVSGEAARTSAGGLVAANVAETANVELDTVRKVGTTKADRMPNFKSDASRCTSRGLGLKKAVMGRANTFTVDCSAAGNNMLYCSVFGPKGPCDETFVKHMGRNMYNVTYQCKERGDHIIMVKWGDDNIPGSPFKVVSA